MSLFLRIELYWRMFLTRCIGNLWDLTGLFIHIASTRIKSGLWSWSPTRTAMHS